MYVLLDPDQPPTKINADPSVSGSTTMNITRTSGLLRQLIASFSLKIGFGLTYIEKWLGAQSL
jgi:hypothetical protein